MNLWRLERLRLWRTHRLTALVAVFAFFGLTAAPLTKWANELITRFGGDQVQIVAPEPRAADAIANYVSNAGQLGLLVVALVAAAALTVDAHRETAVFLRTRVRRAVDLVLPRAVTSWLAASAAFTLGALCAWYGTALLLGSVPVAAMLEGIALGWVYLGFLVAVAAAVGARSGSVVVTTAGTLGVALGLALVGTIRDVGRWLPSHLVASLSRLAAGASFTDELPALAVALAVTAALLVAATALSAHREL